VSGQKFPQSIIEQFTPERWSGECGGQSVEDQVNTPVAGDSEYLYRLLRFLVAAKNTPARRERWSLKRRSALRYAGNLAQQFGLRGYDSVQLAAAELTQTVLRAPVTFASFDNNLNEAARTNGLNLLAIR
jgi:hypothetical protein